MLSFLPLCQILLYIFVSPSCHSKILINWTDWTVCFSAPGPGEGTSSGETPQPPRKKRARVDPTVESVCDLNHCWATGLTATGCFSLCVVFFFFKLSSHKGLLSVTVPFPNQNYFKTKWLRTLNPKSFIHLNVVHPVLLECYSGLNAFYYPRQQKRPGKAGTLNHSSETLCTPRQYQASEEEVGSAATKVLPVIGINCLDSGMWLNVSTTKIMRPLAKL